MLSYFPARYPDELLYSVLARHCRHVGSPGPKQALQTLFGSSTVIAAFDLPGNLDALAARIPPCDGLSVDRIIDQLTLYPYLTAFEPPTIQRQARCAMRSGAVEGLYLRLGLAAFRVGRIATLRFCADCQAEMHERYSEAYWRRDHQLPSALVCPEHGCVLQESNVSFVQRSRHDFIVADPETCPPHARPVAPAMDGKVLSHLHRLAQLSAGMLHSPPASRTFDGWTRYYRSQLLEAGLVRSANHVDQRKLETDFLRFYGRALELLPGVMHEGKPAGGWLATMARKHRKASHPIHHLLLQDFLAHMEKRQSPFGTGPWACLNPLANHDSPLPVTEVKVHRNRGNNVGVFACPCGYTYTRYFDVSRQKFGPARFLRYGPMLEPELRRLISGGFGLRATARILALDPKTVVYFAHQLGIPTPWTLRTSSHGRGRAMETNQPDNGPEVTAPLPKAKTTRQSRRDWPLIDRALALQVMALVKSVSAESPPVRITLAELERRIGNRGWLLKRRHRLPVTSQFLRCTLESLDQFQLRRVHWAIAEAQIGGDSIRAWKIMRKAGLRTISLHKIEAILADRLAAQLVTA